MNVGYVLNLEFSPVSPGSYWQSYSGLQPMSAGQEGSKQGMKKYSTSTQ